MIQDLFASLIKGILGKSGPASQDDANLDLHTPDEILNNLCSLIQRTNEFDMERQVHDIIIANVQYENGGRCIDHEALGPLIHKKGVCDGISKLAKMIFDRIGMASEVVTGILKCSNDIPGPHAWNLVRVNGFWYHLDITADLGLTVDKKHIRYDYFNLSDVEISSDHVRDPISISCSISKKDYYTTKGLFVSDVHQFNALVDQTLKKTDKSLTVRLPRGLEPEITQSKLLDVIKKKCEQTKRCRYRIIYSINPDQMIFSFTVQ